MALLFGAVALVIAGGGTSGYLLTSAGGSAGGASTGSAAPATGASHGAAVPPTPTITSEPPSQTLVTSASFSYSDSLPASSFECKLDSSSYVACGGGGKVPDTGSTRYAGPLLPGTHCFSVEAVLAVLTSSPATYCWQINGQPFAMSWSPASFYPGQSQSANLTIANPDPKAITIPKTGDSGGLTITVTSNNPSACPSQDFGVSQGLLVPVTIPANTTETLAAAGVPSADWPIIIMYDGSGGAGTHTDQDGCKGVSLTITLSAIASGI